MNAAELNEYISNYLENDKSHSAIMLTAPWGTGKSYYIKNFLVPTIDTENEKKCVVVSLYGLKDISEISKSIYLEIRAKKIVKKSEKTNAAKIIGGTVLKGVASFFGVDLSVSEDKLQQLYESIDLTGKLIILEDLERSQIDIIEIMGYVNSLCEQDGVKVLLVANEDEFIKRNGQEFDTEKDKVLQNLIDKYSDKEYPYVEKAKEYLRKKEKTVSDTLYFEVDKQSALKTIINLFFDGHLAIFLSTKKCIDNVISVLDAIESNNLRSVVFACQKTSDILKIYNNSLDNDFIESLLCGNIAFLGRMKKDGHCTWKDSATSPANLGTSTFPLYKVCYDFFMKHHFDKKSLKQEEGYFLKRKELEKNKSEFAKLLVVLESYFQRTEKEVSEAVGKIKVLLERNSGVDFSQYSVLANYLIAVRDCIENVDDIEKCKKYMLSNIHGIGNDAIIEAGIVYGGGIELETSEQKQELEDFKKSLLEHMNNKNMAKIDLSVEKINEFIKYIDKNHAEFRNSGSFANNLSIDEFIEMLKRCTSLNMDNLRRAFINVYYGSNIKDLEADKESLKLIKNKIEELKDSYTNFDKIQIKQLNWFIIGLTNIIKSLS